MKKVLAIIFTFIAIWKANAQTPPGEAEKMLTDSVCGCMTAVDLSKINNKRDAMTAVTDCFGKKTTLLMKVAEEKHVDPNDRAGMNQLGTDLGKDLINANCTAFLKISEKLVLDGDSKIGESDGTTNGKLRRVDLKGFNYVVLTDNNNSEQSFIWLRQFPGSEKFMDGVTKFLGKQVKIAWHEMEVYIPQAKGYFKVKEIRAIEIL